MADLSSEPVVDPRLRDYLDAELRRAELDFPHLPRPAAGRRARRVALGPVLAALAGLALVAVAAVVAIRVAPTPDAASGAPRSSLIVSFVSQTDGVYGYAMLRPTNWTAGSGDFPDGRDYTAPGPFVDQAQGITIHVVNLSLPEAAQGSSDLWTIFEQHPTLADWTAGIENRSLLGGSTMTLLRTLPEARIYSITNPAVTRLSSSPPTPSTRASRSSSTSTRSGRMLISTASSRRGSSTTSRPWSRASARSRRTP